MDLEIDFIIDDIAEVSFDMCDEWAKDKKITDKDMIRFLQEDIAINRYLAERVFDAWKESNK